MTRLDSKKNSAKQQIRRFEDFAVNRKSFMSAFAISSAALSHIKPIVVNIVDQNVKEMRRSAAYMDASEEQKHINYIADTMESSVQTATRALDCRDIVNNIKLKATTNNVLITSQLDELLRKQSEILQLAGNQLLSAKTHYEHQYMPGGLSDTFTAPAITKDAQSTTSDDSNNIKADNQQTPETTEQSQDAQDKQKPATKCKDLQNESGDEQQRQNEYSLSQIFSKLQVSAQSLTDEHNQPIVVKLNQPDDEKDEHDQEDGKQSAWEVKKVWVKTIVLATHFMTAVWLTLNKEVEATETNTPK